jgi:hypothetical protein
MPRPLKPTYVEVLRPTPIDEAVRAALEPHFDVVSVKRDGYVHRYVALVQWPKREDLDVVKRIVKGLPLNVASSFWTLGADVDPKLEPDARDDALFDAIVAKGNAFLKERQPA